MLCAQLLPDFVAIFPAAGTSFYHLADDLGVLVSQVRDDWDMDGDVIRVVRAHDGGELLAHGS